MVLSLDRFKNKVAVVTGASAGIGEAIVKKLVEEGLQVVGIARRVEKVQDLAKRLVGKTGKLYPVKADVTSEDDLLKAFEWIKNNLGPVHILINNAGVIRKTSLVDGSTTDWKKTLDTNVLGLCIATREAINSMMANKIDGHIIHISSISGLSVPVSGCNVYPASKHAVQALTETLRQDLRELGSKIKVTSVCPGLVETEIFEANNFPTSIIGDGLLSLQAEDIADGVIYALSTPPHVQVHLIVIKPVGEKF